ncbi:unnamed protein product [Eruca vesicaria subsp. sativa]|uniref:Transmembrane protein n=1 Tax=Eruca vesicaria subsp. sativa TaxID=29727 RepID=A0ABC8KET6_ERUVS|nr:unnamed protein product [Eruca vesicaria subsp. sativa]
MAKMSRSSKLLVVMLFSFMALCIISHAQTFFPGRKLTEYPRPIPYGATPPYTPVPPECFNQPDQPGCRP